MIRSDNSIVTKLIDYLTDNGGSAEAPEICSNVMGLENCDPKMAIQLIKQGLPEDHRISFDTDGVVKLATRQKQNKRPLKKCQFVVVDVEATSLPKPNNRIIEFAAVQMDYQTVGRSWSTLINPTVQIPRYVQQITGITNQMVKDSPLFESVASEISEFIGDRIIVAHNSAFDVGIINSELFKTDGKKLLNPALCTVRLSRQLVPGLERYRLGEVASYFNIEIEDRHRATGDALAAAKILIHLLDIAEEQEKTDLSHLLKLGGLKNRTAW